MQRTNAAMTIALAACFFATSDRTAAPETATAFSLVLRVAEPLSPSGGDWVVTVGIGASGSGGLAKRMRDEIGIGSAVERWREEVGDALFKRLHMA
jgi:hypothetical protein